MNNRTRLFNCIFILGLMACCARTFAAEYDATLDWNNKITLSTPVTGVIASVHISQGDMPHKDDLLISLDDRYLTVNVEKHRSDVVHYQRLYDEVKRELERTLELYDRELLAMHDRDIAYINMASAEASLRHAQARLKKAELDLEYSSIHAPYDAIVLDLLVHAGETIVNNQQTVPLAILAERGKMQAISLVSYDQLKSMTAGDNASIKINGDSYQGTITTIGFEPVDQTGKYPVNVLFDSGKQLLRAGQPARLVLQ